jgi:hypothetical protein
LFIGIH